MRAGQHAGDGQHGVHVPPLEAADPARETPQQRRLAARVLQHHALRTDLVERTRERLALVRRQAGEPGCPGNFHQIGAPGAESSQRQRGMRNLIEHQRDTQAHQQPARLGEGGGIGARLDRRDLDPEAGADFGGRRREAAERVGEDGRHREVEVHGHVGARDVERAAAARRLAQQHQQAHIQPPREVAQQERVGRRLPFGAEPCLQRGNREPDLVEQRPECGGGSQAIARRRRTAVWRLSVSASGASSADATMAATAPVWVIGTGAGAFGSMAAGAAAAQAVSRSAA